MLKERIVLIVGGTEEGLKAKNRLSYDKREKIYEGGKALILSKF